MKLKNKIPMRIRRGSFFAPFIIKLFQNNFVKNIQYQLWIKTMEPEEDELKQQRNIHFDYEPKISIITSTFNIPVQLLVDMIESILVQTYDNWELCIAEIGSQKHHIKEILNDYKYKDNRIKRKYIDKKKGRARNLNNVISIASGDFITFLGPGDTLAPFAFYEVVKVINNNPDVDFIYSDEDKITMNGRKRYDYHFKSDFNLDMLRTYNYIGHLSVYRKSLGDILNWFRADFKESEDYDLILRITEKAKKIIHIPKILYHRRQFNNLKVNKLIEKPSKIDTAKKALIEHLERQSINGNVEDGSILNSYKITYVIKNNPLISIIIPNHNHYKDLLRCISSIIEKSTYRNFEIIIVENRSTEKNVFYLYDKLKKYKFIKVIAYDKSFNYSSVNNYAVQNTKGNIFLFLNNDTEVINSDWLERMLEHGMRKEVGAVGAKLYFHNNTIQHAGIIIGIYGSAGHSNLFMHNYEEGYMGRVKIVQNLSAVTAACLMVRKDVFESVHGFDERYEMSFNDIDFCLKIREKGYLIVWTPYAELYHYESKTRGYSNTKEKQKKLIRENALFKKRWKTIIEKGDPYYNPNFSLKSEVLSFTLNQLLFP